MVDYKFKTVENLLFYILNAHIHDWIHDFNNYGRMRKIQKYIGELCIYIDRKSGKAGGGRTTRFKGGILKDHEEFNEDEYNDSDDELHDSESEFNEVIQAFTDENKIKTGKNKLYNDDEIVGGLKDTLKDMNELYDFLKTKPATRSNLHTIQITFDYINELKLCIMGYLESIKFKQNRDLGGGGEKFLIDIIEDENIINAINTFENNGKIYVEEEYEKAENDPDYIMNEINIDNVLMFTKCFKICYQNIRNILETFDTTNEECIKLKNEHSLNIFNSRFFEDCLCFFIYSQDKIKDFNDEEITTISKFVINYVLENKYNDTKLILNQNEVPVQESTQQLTKQIKPKTPYNIPPGILAGLLPRDRSKTYNMNNMNHNMNRTNLVRVGGNRKQNEKYKDLLEKNSEYIDLMNDLNDMYKSQQYNELKTEEKIEAIKIIKDKIKPKQSLFDYNENTIIKNSNKKDLIDNFNKLDTLSKRAREPAKIAIIKPIIQSLNTIFTTWDSVKESATREDTDSSSLKLSGEERMSVQQISKIIAINALRLCCNEYIIDPYDSGSRDFLLNKNAESISDKDLLAQIQIIMQVANGGSFTAVDDLLTNYILNEYTSGNILTKKPAIEKLKTLISVTPDNNIRAINNAIDRDFNEKTPPNGINTQQYVICPTSSVCDGMKAFGNCYGKQLVPDKKEYNNMEYNITTDGTDGTDGYYTGRSTIKGNKVNIFYDVKYQELELTNSFILDIKSAPVDLEANVAFRSVIEAIIEIWSRTAVILDEELLWSTLENKEIFLQVLKAGSKKAIGDIFQEINSTLENGAYTTTVPEVNSKLTLGLMGDRPSGARVIKLLKDAKSGTGINTNAVGGYVAPKKSFIYVPNTMLGGGKKQSRKRRKHKRRTNHKKTKKRKTLKKRKPKRFSRSKK